jgi:large subunit ribosomal protein L37Ae
VVNRNRKGQTVLKGLGTKRYSKVYRTLKQKRRCPSCGSLKFMRIACGIWNCPKCNFKVAAGAYDINIEKLQS